MEEAERVPDDEDQLVGFGEETDTGTQDIYVVCAACAAIDRGNLLSPHSTRS